MEDILLTLCIPTNGALQWVKNVIDSIYKQSCNNDLFEVVVVDNGDNSKLEEMIQWYHLKNLRYVRSDVQGFSNQVRALKYGKGKYIKLLNHRSLLVDGALGKLIEMVKQNEKEKAVLFCSNGHMGSEQSIKFDSFDFFIDKLSFWSSWSEGVGIWKDCLGIIDNIPLNPLFPAASLLFGMNNNHKYVIWNDIYEIQQKAERKGGYNFFYAFAVVFLDMLNNLRIEHKISNRIRKDLYRNYLLGYYYKLVVEKNKYTFDLSCIHENMTVYYSSFHYYYMVFYGFVILRIKNIFR